MIIFYEIERWSTTYKWWEDIWQAKTFDTKEDAERVLSLLKKNHPKEAFRITKQTRLEEGEEVE